MRCPFSSSAVGETMVTSKASAFLKRRWATFSRKKAAQWRLRGRPSTIRVTLRLRAKRRSSAAMSDRSEEHTSELQSLMRISYAVFCLKKKTEKIENIHTQDTVS